MKRPAVRVAAVGLATLVLFLARPSSGQISAGQVQDRYNKNTRGTSIDDFVRQLNSEDPEKRLQGVKSLEESKDKKAIEFLVQAMGDQDMRVKAKAIDALGNLRAAEATPVLIQHLFLRTTDTDVKNLILASLGKIGDANSAAPIVEFLRRDLDPALRGTAIYALGDIGNPESLTLLGEIEQKDANGQVRRLAREAATKIRYHQSLLQIEAKEPPETFLKRDQPPGGQP